jgi:uncharacterized membrane protein YeaQ/YmgE (transglycosylase-associated protein family)
MQLPPIPALAQARSLFAPAVSRAEGSKVQLLRSLDKPRHRASDAGRELRQRWEAPVMIHFIVFLITGLVAGVIADHLMGRRHGWLVAMIIGLIGGLIGGWLATHFHVAARLHLHAGGIEGWLIEVAIAVVGAVLLLFVLGLFRRRGP